LEKQKAHLEDLSAYLAGGDIGRGQQLYFGKAACAACHRVSGQGGLIGPNLTGIAEVRTGRDLLESVIYPSASIVQGYQPFNIQTQDGQSYSGILVRQTPDAVWLRGADLAEVKVEAQRIASMTESTVSLMPQGLDTALSRDEFRDLLAFLQSLKRLSAAAVERTGK
jgi:putative heme-binding domain-containing protein